MLSLIKRKSSYNNFRQNRLQSKGSYQGKRRALHDDRWVNCLRRHKILNVCAPKNRVKLREAKTNRAARRNRWRRQHFPVIIKTDPAGR